MYNVFMGTGINLGVYKLNSNVDIEIDLAHKGEDSDRYSNFYIDWGYEKEREIRFPLEPNIYKINRCQISGSGVIEQSIGDSNSLVCVTLFESNYIHLLFDVIARILYINRSIGNVEHIIIFKSRDELRQMINNKIFVAAKQALEKIGIDFNKNCITMEDFSVVEIANMVSTYPYTCIPMENYAISSRILREKFAIEGYPSKKVYIARNNKNVTNDSRVVKDEEKIQEYFKGQGYDIVHNEHLNFEEQLSLYSNASHIAGITGAGLGNILFAPTGCKVFDIKTSLKRRDELYRYISMAIDLEYHSLNVEDCENSGIKIVDKIKTEYSIV